MSDRRRGLILAVCCMSLLIVGLDNTIVNVALPSIQREFHATVADLQWTIDSYIVVLASLLILSGSTADRLGRRRVFQAGLVLFTGGSFLCGLAPSLGWLVAARVVQAVGGSMLNPVAMSIITNTFTVPRERARAIGVWSGVVGISMALGPVVGGLLVGTVGWRAIFWINIPIGLAAVVATALFVPESRAPRPRRPDLVGQVLVIVLLGAVTSAIIEWPTSGWAVRGTLCALAVAALAALLYYEPRRTDPLLELRFFRSAPFSGATLIAVASFAALGGFLFLNTLYLQNVRGMSAVHAGLAVLPMAGMVLVFGPLSGRLVGRRGPRLPLLLAGAAFAVSGAMMLPVTATTPLGWLVAAYAVFGFGFAVVNPPVTQTAVSGMPRAQAGVAAAIASTSRQVGQSLGVAVAGALVAVAGPLTAAAMPWPLFIGYGLAVIAIAALTTPRGLVSTVE
ncbi:MFS transporter [Longispora sp. K20-0274]|uniref:MFS transporter n=1 Tax=Longispora sp. K20-0274 TaxID=3088255 RepID=UPI00399999A3